MLWRLTNLNQYKSGAQSNTIDQVAFSIARSSRPRNPAFWKLASLRTPTHRPPVSDCLHGMSQAIEIDTCLSHLATFNRPRPRFSETLKIDKELSWQCRCCPLSPGCRGNLNRISGFRVPVANQLYLTQCRSERLRHVTGICVADAHRAQNSLPWSRRAPYGSLRRH